MLTVQQRLGMVLALLGKYEQAREMLQDVAPALGEQGAQLVLPLVANWAGWMAPATPSCLTEPDTLQSCMPHSDQHLQMAYY